MEKLFITPNDVIGKNDSESIQNAVNAAHSEGINKVVIPRMNLRTGEPMWVIEETVKLPSDMLIVLDNCFMQMADDVVGGFFKSENLFTEWGCDPARKMRNIRIKGEGRAVLDGGKPTELNEETQSKIGVPVRLNSPIFFMNVEGFSVENITVQHQRYWGMRFQFCSRGVVRDIFFDCCRDRRNQDGINLRCGCHDILIENIYGQTGDDMIALSAIDRHAEGMFKNYDVIVRDTSWDIHDVTIRNISGAGILHPLITMRNHNGAKIYNIHIENVKDTAQTQDAYEEENLPAHSTTYEYGRRYALVLLGDNAYYQTPSVLGDTYNITIKDLYCTYSNTAVTVRSTVKNCTVQNVHGSGRCRSAVTVLGNEIGDDFLGVQIDGMVINGVQLDVCEPDCALIDFRYMREGDFVKDLSVSGVVCRGVDAFMKIHKRAKIINMKIGADIICPENIEWVEPFEVKRCDIHFKSFQANIQRKYEY